MQILLTSSIALVALALTPKLFLLVAKATEDILVAHDLGQLNPGNASGLLVGYAAVALFLSFTARGLRNKKKLTAKELFWWIKACTLVAACFLLTRHLGTTLIDKQFGFLTAIATTALCLVQVSRIKFPEYDFDPHVQGPRLTTSQEIQRTCGHLPSWWLSWGADRIKPINEKLHFLILGNIGGGKTTYMKMMMAMCGNRENELWIVFDPKIEMIPYLTALGKQPLIFNPLDQRSVAWDLCQDIVNASMAEGLAQLLIPENSADGDNHWVEAAKSLIAGVIEVFIMSGLPWDLRDLCLATKDSKDLMALFERLPNDSEIKKGLSGVHRSGANDYVLTTSYRLKPLHVIASRWHKSKTRVSIRQLVQHRTALDNYALVLGTDHTSGSIVNSINSLIFERLGQIALNGDESPDVIFRVWADEFSSVSKQTGKNFVRFMTIARSKGGSLVLLAQNRASFVDKLGEHLARQIFDTAVHKTVIGGVDGETAKLISEEVGNHDVIEIGTGYASAHGTVVREIQKGKSQQSAQQDVHQSYRRVTRPVVPKELLTDTGMRSAGPEDGLTGFFMGSKSGPHFHHFSWDKVMAMQVKPDADTSNYQRIDERSPDYQLEPWSASEREKWGLAPLDLKTNPPSESPLPDWSNTKTYSRTEILELVDITEPEFIARCAHIGLAADLEKFTLDQIDQLDLMTTQIHITQEA